MSDKNWTLDALGDEAFDGVNGSWRPDDGQLPTLNKAQEIVKLAAFTLLFAVGAPMNLAALSQLWRTRKAQSASGRRMHLLKMHLNASDLMILFLYTSSSICWLLTYEWRGGELLCKVTKYLQMVSFGISSYVIVCIAFDRTASTFESRRRNPDDDGRPGLRRVKWTLLIAWLMAFASALPQFQVWVTFQPFQPDSDWTQCVAVWFAREMQLKRYNTTNMPELWFSKEAYIVYHVVSIFWIPALLIAAFYFHLMVWLIVHSHSGARPFRKPGQAADEELTGGTKLQRITGRLLDLVIRRTSRMSLDSVQMRPTAGTPTTPVVNSRNGSLANGGGGGRGYKGSGCSNAPLLAAAPANANANANSANAAAANVGGGRQRPPGAPAALPQDLSRVKRRAIRISVLLVGAYIVTWMPYNMLALWQFIDEAHYLRYGSTVSFMKQLIVFNSVINPFLYGTVGSFRKYTTNG